jgi:predicted ATPase/class 3 adenylate cyclase
MRRLPEGTVTFLFSDVEGSTRLLHDLGPDAYARALAGHRVLVRDTLRAHAGVEVDTQGDAFFLAFPTAQAAVESAHAIAAALADGAIRVRIGVHTGTPLLTDEGYVGEDVHRAARIAACGHGGQVLLSAATAALVGRDGLRDLGEHRLKDLSAPERIYQLGGEEFRPLKSLYRTNLPVMTTPFIGRQRELADLASFLARDEVRLVTVTGPGGAGKTRLALQAAAASADRYPDGTWWVPLATVRDPDLVVGAATRAAGAEGDLGTQIGDKTMLFVLDNVEHLLGAGSDLAVLLARCPNVDLLVTSREPLHLSGEQEYPVAGLRPGDSSRLFIARARAANPGLVAGDEVAEICRRLDELPLALELAASRVKALSTVQILTRLERRLPLLTGGARDLPERQRTLRATIEWSHELLTGEEQTLFARFAVFPGGATLDAAEVVARADLDTLQSLVDKSLVRHSGERFWMFETIREYALERLEAAGADADEVRRSFATYFLELAEACEPALSGAGQLAALERLEDDYANIRASLAWFAEARDWSRLQRLGGSLKMYWTKRGYLSDGRHWLDVGLEPDAGARSPERLKALAAATLLATLRGEWMVAERRGTEGCSLALELGKLVEAAAVMLPLGRAVLALGDRARAVELFEEAARLGQETNNDEAVALAAFNLGYLALADGDLPRAEREFRQVLLQAGVDEYLLARSLAALGSVALRDGRTEEAAESLRLSLARLRGISGPDDTAAWAIELLGCAVAASERGRAARLLGSAERMREDLGARLEGIELELHDRTLAALAAGTSPSALFADWQVGRDASFERTLEEALEGAARS